MESLSPSTGGVKTSTTSISEETMVGDLENQRVNLNSSNPRGESNIGQHGVDVAAAEAEFMELSRQLSGLSRRMTHNSIRDAQHSGNGVKDYEKGAGEGDDEQFDLEAHLRGVEGEERNAGIKPKQIGVLWQDLTVSGIGGVKNYIATFPDAFISFFNVFGTIRSIFGMDKKGREFDILKNIRGVAKPGEMILVLGRPGSGCTTFLKVIANQRFGYTKVDGEVLYGRFGADTFAKRFRGEAVYNQEDDIHHPTLTVGQTLGFALDTKTPAKRIPGMTTAEFKERVINLLLKMFNIEHTVNTVVGNPFVRGVSGGERKRVSIAEMMITKATVCCWDNSTRGLDASTALDYAKSLRIMTNIYKTTTFVSLYQASENIYEQFDKVLVIDSGREVYYGPTREARAYFEGLGFAPKPRQTTPDYLTGCTDEYEREYADSRASSTVPSSPEELEKAFHESPAWTALNEEMEQYREEINRKNEIHEHFITAVKEDKRLGTSKKSVYTIPYHRQIWALMKRQFLLKWQDKFSLAVSWITSIAVAIVTGTLYLDLPKTSAGAFTRGGLMFIALLFNAFQAFSELASTMLGRPIVNKHKAFTFHRPSALWLAQICVDLVFASTQILVFSIIVYFMTNLARSAGAFFTFYLMILSGYIAMTLFFRTVGCLCPDFDYAMKFAAVIITLFVITSGYLIPSQAQGDWLSWIFYINGLGLGFSAMMMNEFKRVTLRCTSESLVPSGPGYNDLNHQTCTLAGSKPGTNFINGGDYINLTFSYNPDHLWRNFGIIMTLIVFFLGANALLGEYFQYGAGGKTVTFYAKENAERKKLNQELNSKLQERRSKRGQPDESGSNLKIESKAVLTWENLSYDVPIPNGQIRLLKDVFGYVKPGQLTALMGASGAGKTTLLDVLAARKNIGVISGDILIDGKPPGTSFQRGTSYAEQLDVHESTQTVREALRFSAYLRQPYEVPIEEKNAYVEEVIALLEMENIADAIIGDPTTGLAVEERKRVTIGVELAAKPELLLFLDEPTSGLDSQSAFNIVRFLKKLANAGQAILCTIHQPNASLFENFDRLLLLQRGGECVYFGDIGKDAEVLLNYFYKYGAHCPQNANPAEWMLDAIGAGQAPRIGDRDWGEIWRSSDELKAVKEEIKRLQESRIAEIGSAPPVVDKEYATPLSYQIKLVMKRTNLSFWRSPNYGFTRFFNHIAIALLSGLCFLDLDDSRASMQYRVFIIFQVTVLPALILAQVEPKYDIARMIFYREQSSKMYSQFAFALSMVIAELPYSILCAFGFFVCLYFPPGMSTEPDRAGYQFLMILVTEIFSVTLGQAIAALTPSAFIGALLNPFLLVTLSLFCGVTVPKPNMPKFWRSWLYELNPFTRLISGMVVTELHSTPVNCAEWEYNTFTPPPGQTCESYAADFLNLAPGYLRNASTTAQEICQYCAYRVGDEFFEALDLSFDDRWRDFGIFVAFVVSNLAILFLASRHLNFSRR
ncbi:ABC-2 type transporter-domain-containing protein [Kalaharituber pfeilii]|nr:ABC-2 type transporter-domain-containing protein [Kalaharituber pfeilii]